jgi:hypothetical protein
MAQLDMVLDNGAGVCAKEVSDFCFGADIDTGENQSVMSKPRGWRNHRGG